MRNKSLFLTLKWRNTLKLEDISYIVKALSVSFFIFLTSVISIYNFLIFISFNYNKLFFQRQILNVKYKVDQLWGFLI